MTPLSKTRTSLAGLYSSSLSIEDCSLLVIGGPHQGMQFRLEHEVTRIGRADWCDIVLKLDPLVSTIHCELWLDERGVRIRDLKSRNGVIIEGYPVFDAYLKEDAVFEIGDSTFQLKFHHQTRELSIQYQDDSGTLVGKSAPMRKLFSLLGRLAQRKVMTLLTGETGTGKTTVARAIHLQSDHAEQPFVVVNCGALPSTLIESLLFGYEKGAFTGANARHKGFFQQANGGTLFLDEIAELPIDLQPKLLDVIERRKVRPLGSEKEYDVDFHLIAATLRHLPSEIEAGRFREDLYFRLSVFELEVPPLRERIEDFSLIVEKLMEELSPDEPIGFTKAAMDKLKSYLWPGNIRQLRNILERSLVFLEGNIVSEDELSLPKLNDGASTTSSQPGASSLAGTNSSATMASTHPLDESLLAVLPTYPLSEQYEPIDLKIVLGDVEKNLISQALIESERDVQEAAALLSVSPPWLYTRIRKYELRTKNKRRT